MLFLLTASLMARAGAEEVGYQQTLQQQLTLHVQQRLDDYLQTQAWPQGDSSVEVWLPAGANHVPVCQQAIHIEAADHDARPWGRQLYRMECLDPVWQLQARADVRLTLPVIISSRDLAKGHMVQANDLQNKPMEIHRLFRDFTINPADLLGRKVLRRVRVGQILTQEQLQARILVKKGDIVLIRAGSNDFSATMKGEAQQDGIEGDSVKVKNLSSGRIIQGWVVEMGIVETRY